MSDIICLSVEPSPVPGFYSMPQFDPTRKFVTGWSVQPGSSPEDYVNPCKPKAEKKTDEKMLQELGILDDIGNALVDAIKGKDKKDDDAREVITDPLCNPDNRKAICLATEPVHVQVPGGVWNMPIFDGSGEYVTSWTVTAGFPPSCYVNPCIDDYGSGNNDYSSDHSYQIILL